METAMPAAASTREQTTADVSPLLRLPDELLSNVIADVDGDVNRLNFSSWSRHWLPWIAQTCRRLLPIARAYLYRDVCCGSVARCCCLIATVKSKPELGALVKTLHVEPLVEQYSIDESLDGFGEGFETGWVVEEAGIPEIGSLLRQLSNVEHLSIGSFQVDESVAILALARGRQHLVKVSLNVEADDVAPESARVCWEALLRLPALMDLSLQPGLPLLPRAGSHVEQMERLRSLTLISDWRQHNGPLDLASLAPNLEQLVFPDNPGRSGWPIPILSTAPFGLTSLRLLTEADCNVDAALPRFAFLTELVVCGGRTFTPDALLRYLSTSQVQTLHFRSTFGDRTINDVFLLALVHGGLRPKKLRLLLLNHRSPRCPKAKLASGWNRALERPAGLPFLDIKTQIEHALKVWTSRLPEGCTEAGLVRVLEAAQQFGVVVQGSALDCIGWDTAFRDVLEQSLVDRFFPAESQETFVDVLGPERAVDVLHKYRAELVELLGAGRGE